jgi:cellulose synthase/poly-beta-1,6-N-acetylglucosamine synthase-like glycosyltransferase
LLSRCLTALLAQNFDKADYEVIVVDDASSDDTKRLVECFAKQIGACGPRLRYSPVGGLAEGCHPEHVNRSNVIPVGAVPCARPGEGSERNEGEGSHPSLMYRPSGKVTASRHGPAVARNIGWRAASGEIIAFTDDDCLPAPNWLKAGVKAFVDGVVGVSGKLIVPLACTPTDYERNAAHLSTAEFVTANCFYLRSALASVGGFDERFTSAWREDSDLFFTLLQGNGKFLFVPEAVVIHPVRPARWGISLRQQRKSMFNALLYKKHPTLYRQRIQATPPWHYYCIVVAGLSALIAGLVGLWLLVAALVCLWLCLTTRFCLQRLHHTSHAPRHIVEMIVTSILIPPLAIYWRNLGAVKYRVFFL